MLLFIFILLSRSAMPEASTDTAKKDIVLIDQAAQLYRVQYRGACPTEVDALGDATKVELHARDPWGTDYRLSCPDSQGVSVASAGPDKTFGSDDDLDNAHD